MELIVQISRFQISRFVIEKATPTQISCSACSGMPFPNPLEPTSLPLHGTAASGRRS
ncbi:hypothetical protein BDZ91DRAFT_425918 [Kalaharituber pfeilii]|nr:hypothetical protein BDZ91DRAFT_425918 [Kalaharituber pfeilii]